MAYFGGTHARPTELHGTAALVGVATFLGAAFGLSTVVTPLYLIYQQQFGLSQFTLTLIYAAYAIGNIGALLFLGRLSDQVGRRSTALLAIASLIVAALVFLFANGLATLYAARILTGLGIGIASGTGNAWLAELIGKHDKTRAATIGTSANFLGLGVAPLVSGLLAQYAPWPLQLSFIVYLVILCAVAALAWFTQETARDADPGRVEFWPKLSIPPDIRARFVAPAIAGFGLMALVGFYAALMPVILSQDLDIKNHAAAGALSTVTSTTIADIAFASMVAIFALVALIFDLAYRS